MNKLGWFSVSCCHTKDRIGIMFNNNNNKRVISCVWWYIYIRIIITVRVLCVHWRREERFLHMMKMMMMKSNTEVMGIQFRLQGVVFGEKFRYLSCLLLKFCVWDDDGYTPPLSGIANKLSSKHFVLHFGFWSEKKMELKSSRRYTKCCVGVLSVCILSF